jgi:serine/threonine-protein phosphatase 5
MALSRYKDSLKDLRTVCKYAPNDPDARAKLKEGEKMIRIIEFEKALCFEEEKVSIVESLHVSEIVVEDSYDGMRWNDDEPLTIDWIKDMVDRFEKQKKIHRKYVYKVICMKVIFRY